MPRWVHEGFVSVQESPGARRSLAGLIDKLLPLAKEKVIVFEEQRRERYADNKGPIIVVRLTPWLQKRLAELAHIGREQRVAFVAAPLAYKLTGIAWNR